MALKAHIAKPHWIPVVTNLSINFAVLGLVAYFGNTLFLLLALSGSISSIGSSFLSWYTTRLIITTKFVQYRTGLFWKTHMNLRHRQLEAITYVQNPVGLIFNFGTVHITGTGSTHLTIPYLMAPAKVVGAFNYAHDKANEMALRADAREPG